MSDFIDHARLYQLKSWCGSEAAKEVGYDILQVISELEQLRIEVPSFRQGVDASYRRLAKIAEALGLEPKGLFNNYGTRDIHERIAHLRKIEVAVRDYFAAGDKGEALCVLLELVSEEEPL